MTDLIISEQANLPATLEELSKFVLIGRDKLQSVRAEINAIKKLDVARELREQKLAEAQEIGALVLLAEAKCGELFNSLPKVKENQYTKSATSTRLEMANDNNTSKSKLETAKELGFSKDQVSQFQKLADNPELIRKNIADAKYNGDIPTRSAVLHELKKSEKEEKAAERLERKQFELPDEMPDDVCKLFLADIQDGLPQIENNSVDFIITDPPYPREFIPLYGELSKVAARVLIKGGSLVCMCGQSSQLFQKKVHSFWKPVLWFIKESYEGDWAGDVLKSAVNDNDKRFHQWGQSVSGMLDIVERFTYPNQIILDPFVGGGTTGVASVIKGRKFIGTDINQDCLNITEKRIKEAYRNAGSQT